LPLIIIMALLMYFSSVYTAFSDFVKVRSEITFGKIELVPVSVHVKSQCNVSAIVNGDEIVVEVGRDVHRPVHGCFVEVYSLVKNSGTVDAKPRLVVEKGGAVVRCFDCVYTCVGVGDEKLVKFVAEVFSRRTVIRVGERACGGS